MKTLLYMENNHAGGMDTFLINLLNNWELKENEKIIVVCNKNHPGLDVLKSRINIDYKLIEHEILIGSEITDRLFFFFPKIIIKIIRQILRVLLSYYQYRSIKEIFRKIDANKLLVINGGYPGGETSRLANIAWSNMGRGTNIHTFHNFAIKPRLFFRTYENFIDSLLVDSVNYIISVSEVCANSLNCRKYLSASNKISYIYNGVEFFDDSHIKDFRHNLREELNIGDGIICLMMGTYEPRKGHLFLINAFNRACIKKNNLHLIICGDSTNNDKKIVENLKNMSPFKNRIHLLDYIENGHLLINQADILLISSQEWESFGYTAAEAMARKVPIISTNIGGLKEVVGQHKVTGFLFNKDNEVGFSDAILRLSNDKFLRKEIGLNGYYRGKEMFHVKKMAARYKEKLKN